MIDLGTLGGTSGQAEAVNPSGQVVGFSTTAGDAEGHAFSWTQTGGMVDLGTLGGTYSVATAVNARGQVVGSSSTAGDTEDRAFSWTQAGGMIDLGATEVMPHLAAMTRHPRASGPPRRSSCVTI